MKEEDNDQDHLNDYYAMIWATAESDEIANQDRLDNENLAAIDEYYQDMNNNHPA
jgi:hypothetical protein